MFKKPRITPSSLRPGVDKLKVIAYDAKLPFDTVGTFHRTSGDYNIDVVLEGGELATLHISELAEAERLQSDLDPVQFDLEYLNGAEGYWEGARPGGGDPDRPFARGWRDARDGRVRHGWEPYNEAVRAQLAATPGRKTS